MALAHNLIIRFLNSIYLQSTGVTKQTDIADFLFYCQAWCGLVHEHHNGEEQKFFPLIEASIGEKGIMDSMIEEHRAFDAGFDVFQKHVIETKPVDYNGEKIRSLINNFAGPLVAHLHAEIKKLVKVGEAHGGESFQIMWDDVEAKIMEDSKKWDPVSPLCFFGELYFLQTV